MDVFDGRREFLERHSLGSQVFCRIREGILSGKYPPGTAIREGKISRELGVSRTPVREAIRQLELEGLVSVYPNKGAVVTGVNEKDIQDIFAIRSQLEGMAAEWAAARLTQTQFRELQDIVELMEFYTSKHSLDKLVDLDSRFHEIIYEASGSSPLHHVLASFHYFVQKARMVSLSTPGRAELVVNEHRAILDALQREDGESAKQSITLHVQNAAANVQREKAVLSDKAGR